MKYPKGSLGAAEEKDTKIVSLFAIIVSIAIFLCLFVFHTDLKSFAHRASTFDNIVGSILILGSAGWVALSSIKGYEGKHAAWVWLAGLALGICLCCGFNFDYFGLK